MPNGRESKHSVQGKGHEQAIAAIQKWFAGAYRRRETGFCAVGHRIVHGGQKYLEPVRIDDAVLAGLQELVPLAPLHEPHQIEAIRAIMPCVTQNTQVACFDTAFHRTQPAIAREFALPREFAARGIRRYGFHGLSYEYIVARCRGGAGVRAGAHGGGASGQWRELCAIEQGRSVATTMGLTASGWTCRWEPGAARWILEWCCICCSTSIWAPPQIEHCSTNAPGCWASPVCRATCEQLLESAIPSAKQAVDMFVYWIGREIGSLAAAMGGLDALIFTGGIGEHAHQIRSLVCRTCEVVGRDTG
jgi:acetate kinase